MRPSKGLLLVVAVANVPLAWAQVPTRMNYQGRLTDLAASPITAQLPMTFRIFDSLVGGAALWVEAWQAPRPEVVVNDGIFSVELGTFEPLLPSLFPVGADRFLEIVVDGEVLTPRQRLSSSSWAFHAEESEDSAKLGGADAADWQRRVAGACPPGSSVASVNADGSVVCETDDVGLLSEADPQVGALSTDSVPRWDGVQLVDGVIKDDGTVVHVAGSLEVAGQVESGAGGFRFPDGTVQGSAAAAGTAFTYVHWGLDTCPGSILIQAGQLAGLVHTTNTYTGMGPLCIDAALAGPWIAGTVQLTLERVKRGPTGFDISFTSNVPCAVCEGQTFTLWGRSTCPAGRTVVYTGHVAALNHRSPPDGYDGPMCLDDAVVATWGSSPSSMTLVRRGTAGSENLDASCPCVVCK